MSQGNQPGWQGKTVFTDPLTGAAPLRALVGKRLGAGGEGAVYQDASRPGYVLKIMHAPTAQSEAKTRAMLASPPAAQVGQYQGQDLVQLAWPQELLTDGQGGYIGFSMRYLDMSRTVGLTVWMIPRERRLNQLSEDDRFRVHLAANLASVTDYVNQAGHALIDLKPLNILAYRQGGYVCLVDCDGFRIQSNGVVFPASAYTPDYLAPEYQTASFTADRCGEEQDWFALAVIVYELLDNGIHPFHGIDQADPQGSYTVPTRIAQQRTFLDPGSGLQAHKSSQHHFFADDTLALFLLAFTGTPAERPSSGEWKAHLQDLAQYRMRQCSANPDHWDYGKGCPWCLSKPVQIPPPAQINSAATPQFRSLAAGAGAAAPSAVPAAQIGSFAGGSAVAQMPPSIAPNASKSKLPSRWRAISGVLIAVAVLVVAWRAVVGRGNDVVGKVDVSHFAGLRPGDTPKRVAALHGEPSFDNGEYRAYDEGYLDVLFQNDSVRKVEVARDRGRDFVRSRAGGDALLDLIGQSEAGVDAMLGPPRNRLSRDADHYALCWDFPMAGRPVGKEPPGTWSAQTVCLDFEHSACWHVTITW